MPAERLRSQSFLREEERRGSLKKYSPSRLSEKTARETERGEGRSGDGEMKREGSAAISGSQVEREEKIWWLERERLLTVRMMRLQLRL